MEREDGFYRVKLLGGKPEIAKWENGKWWLVGFDEWVSEKSLTVLGPRLAFDGEETGHGG